MEYQQDEAPQTAIPTAHPSRILPIPRLSTLFSFVIIGFLLYAFFTGLTKQFYASVVFLFYSLTKSMWVSVVMLGIFQTLLLIPLRIISLIKSANLKEFEDAIKRMKIEKEQAGFLKKSFKSGRRVALYYTVNFVIQLVSYISIGRLFLTDFYSKPLDPKLLYDFVPYPKYPITDRWFKIPYLWFSDTKDLGMHWVWIVWIIIIGIQAVFFIYRSLQHRLKAKSLEANTPLSRIATWLTGSTVMLLFLSWLLIRHFPIQWSLRIFSGDVAYPNPSFNTLTAIVTALTLIWINIPRINKKVAMAKKAGIDAKVIGKTEKAMLAETLQSAILLGLGAYFITNLIPCAFELSVFTLELISLLSPLTLDRAILGTVKGQAKPEVKVEAVETAKAAAKPETVGSPAPESTQPKLEGEIKF